MRREIAIGLLGLLLVGINVLPAEARGRRSYNGSDYGYGYTNPGSQYIGPTITQNGGYRSGYFRTTPNGTDKDNYNTLGNTNPWTGRSGTRRSRSSW